MRLLVDGLVAGGDVVERDVDTAWGRHEGREGRWDRVHAIPVNRQADRHVLRSHGSIAGDTTERVVPRT